MVGKPLFQFASYDTAKYPFAEIIGRDVLRTQDLSRYHEVFLQQNPGRTARQPIRHQDNMAARELLKTMDKDSEFHRVYQAFLQEVLAPLFPTEVHFVTPVYRVQMAGSTSISGWHRDVDVTGRSDLITAWIPFIDAAGSNTLWVEAEYGKQDYVPIPVAYGQIFLFDSAWLWHGSVTNDSAATRVSMDVRMIPLKAEKGADLGIFAARPKWIQEQIRAARSTPSAPVSEYENEEARGTR